MIQPGYKRVRVTKARGSFGVGQELLVKEEKTAPYYDGPAHLLWGGESSVPASCVSDI